MKVVVSRRIPDEGLDILRRARHEVWVNPEDRPMTPEELRGAVREADGFLSQLVDHVDGPLLEAGPRLRVIANYAAGTDNIDLAAAGERGIVVANTPGVLSEATAELAWGLLLAAARRVPEGDRLVREGGFRGWAPLLHLGVGVSGKTLGLVGAGRIAAAVARMSLGFRMRVLYTSRTPHPDFERETGARRRDLESLLRESDFVSLHVPLTPETRHLIGARELAWLKPTAVLINTARGPLVDEAALVEALRAGRPFAAGLDVFENEPALAPDLADLPNVVLAPHAGSATTETRVRMAVLAAENIVEVLNGRPPRTAVPTR